MSSCLSVHAVLEGNTVPLTGAELWLGPGISRGATLGATICDRLSRDVVRAGGSVAGRAALIRTERHCRVNNWPFLPFYVLSNIDSFVCWRFINNYRRQEVKPRVSGAELRSQVSPDYLAKSLHRLVIKGYTSEVCWGPLCIRRVWFTRPSYHFPLHLQAEIWLVVARKYHRDIESSRLTLPLIALGVFSCHTHYQMNWTMKEHYVLSWHASVVHNPIPFRLTKCEKVPFDQKHWSVTR